MISGYENAICIWREDAEGNWDTSCENTFVMVDGTPMENEFRFCAFCGGSLVEQRYTEAESK